MLHEGNEARTAMHLDDQTGGRQEAAQGCLLQPARTAPGRQHLARSRLRPPRARTLGGCEQRGHFACQMPTNSVTNGCVGRTNIFATSDASTS